MKKTKKFEFSRWSLLITSSIPAILTIYLLFVISDYLILLPFFGFLGFLIYFGTILYADVIITEN